MSKKKWEINEEKCLKYLQETFQTNTVKFESRGGSDSTESDIIVLKNGIKACYIEAKMNKSQCGQFVLFPDNERRSFEYSRRNHPSEPSLQAEEIIDKMNDDYDRYCTPSTSNKLDLDKNLFYNWIIEHYKERQVEFFIVSYNKNYFIFPTKNFEKYFDVSAKYRIKKSGSQNPNKKDCNALRSFFATHCALQNSLIKNGKKTFVNLPNEKDKIIIDVDENSYQLSRENGDLYRVTRLSHTFNANVIFSISLKKYNQEQHDLNDFRIFLEMP